MEGLLLPLPPQVLAGTLPLRKQLALLLFAPLQLLLLMLARDTHLLPSCGEWAALTLSPSLLAPHPLLTAFQQTASSKQQAASRDTNSRYSSLPAITANTVTLSQSQL
jgi:hypothetical protein